jgi:hypothetical protein
MKHFVYIFSVLLFGFLLCIPFQATFAQTNSNTATTNSNTNTPASSGNSNSNSSSTKNFGIDQASNINLPSQSLPVFIGTIIRWIMGMLGVVLVAMFVYGGVTYATAAGNEERASSAKRILTYAIIGSVIVVASAIISEFVLNALLSQPTNTPVITNSASSTTGTNSGSTSATPSTGAPTTTSGSSSNSGTRLPTTNQRGLATLCSPGGTSCSTGFACTKEPTGAQYYCLIPKGRECNTNTSSVVGDHGCEFNTTCVKKKNPTTPAGLPDFSQNDGVCE